ncbi:HtaA domain-containing protein [Paenarthrobacter aromaticivorans]|uniref:HtaA domain-containing protein n=1 Tax=Paenarthrobacter aromaticivorans TaxID=2849150 RepID=A0ABS6IDN5_9MICC|nr:HtaA domain-containing protein [Paenarthrobacter sp. MMS21-TAE1-1]MBU8868489.1 HtaA domain-containing protein [Paenarthrobacter sp. MMS21-TAE1-1]
MMTPQDVARLHWGIDPHFLAYVGSLPDGMIEAREPAEQRDHDFLFPEVGTQPGRIQFAGAIRFFGHGGLLEVLLQDPAIESDKNGSILTVTGPSGRAAMLNLRTTDSERGTLFESTLRGEAVQWFGGVYLPGRPFGQVRICRRQSG